MASADTDRVAYRKAPISRAWRVALLALAASTVPWSTGCLDPQGLEETDEESSDLTGASFRGTAIRDYDRTLPDVDTLGYDFDLDATARGDAVALVGSVSVLLVATRPLDSVDLDYTGRDAVKSVRLGRRVLTHQSTGEKLRVSLGRTIEKGRAFTLRVELEANSEAMGVGRASSPGLTRDTGIPLFSANWPNRARQWFPGRDNPRDAAMFAVRVRTANGYVAVSNGTRKVRPLPDGRSETTQELLLPIPTYGFFIGISSDWQSKSLAPANDKPVESFVRPGHDVAARAVLAPVQDALVYFERTFGAYRWPLVRYIDVPTSWGGGGMEHVSAIAIDPYNFSRPTEGRTVSIHELAHHWSGDLVRIGTWNDFWLSEGMTEYLTRRFVEDHDGAAAAEALWQESVQGGRAAPHALRPAGELEGDATPKTIMGAIFDNVAYTKGAWVLRTLERKIGREKFTSFLRGWFTRHAFQAVRTEDLERDLKQETGQDFADFFRRCVYGRENPE